MMSRHDHSDGDGYDHEKMVHHHHHHLSSMSKKRKDVELIEDDPPSDHSDRTPEQLVVDGEAVVPENGEESQHGGESQDGHEESMKKARTDAHSEYSAMSQFNFGQSPGYSDKVSHHSGEMSAPFLGLDTAVASGSVPDMSTVASSIASLSAQPPPPGWGFVMPSEKGNGAMSPTQLAQQQQLYQQLLMQHQAWCLQNMRELAQGHDNDPNGVSVRYPMSDRSGMNETTMYGGEQSGLFVILEQPNEVQRKSYKNENRCLLPNPITVCARDISGDDPKRAPIVEGTVTVQLVDQDGAEMTANKASMLDSVEKSMTQHLDENLTAQFSLKIMETSEGNMYRLLFNITYRLKGMNPMEEKLLSRPFIVYSNRKKHVKAGQKRPSVLDMKPDRAESNREVEVWIKGRGFCDKSAIVVTFGDKIAKVLDATDNLVTVLSPIRDDIIQDTPVQITVSNRVSRDVFSAEKKPTFTHLLPK